MDYTNLGKTGLKVSRICLGCMTYGEPATGETKGGRHAWALNEEESQPSFGKRLISGSISSTPPMYTPAGPARKFWGAS